MRLIHFNRNHIGLLLAAALPPAAAMAQFDFEAGELPIASHVDSCVETNISFNAAHGALKEISFSMALDQSVSNAVEIAFGTDIDGSGALDEDETLLAFSCESRRMFAFNGTDGQKYELAGDDSQGRRNFSARLVQTDGGGFLFWAGGSGGASTFCLNNEMFDGIPGMDVWDTCRIARRGPSPASERVSCEIKRPWFRVILR